MLPLTVHFIWHTHFLPLPLSVSHYYHRAWVFFCLVCDQSTRIFLLMKIQMNTQYALTTRERKIFNQWSRGIKVSSEQMTIHESMTQHTNASCVSWCVRLCTLSYQNYCTPGEFTTFFFHSTLTLSVCVSRYGLFDELWVKRVETARRKRASQSWVMRSGKAK